MIGSMRCRYLDYRYVFAISSIKLGQDRNETMLWSLDGPRASSAEVVKDIYRGGLPRKLFL